MLRIARISLPLLVSVIALLAWSPAVGDPLPGQVLKFQQLPMVATTIGQDPPVGDTNVYFGHDERSTARLLPGTGIQQYQGIAMADDFADEFDTPVVHVRWWGSYLNEQQKC